jgi:hypothetical protein
MTLTLEVPPVVERSFRAGARRRGVPEAEYLRELLEQDTAPGAPGAAATFLELTAELMPRIEAGVLAPVGASELLEAVRDEREAELTGALRGKA